MNNNINKNIKTYKKIEKDLHKIFNKYGFELIIDNKQKLVSLIKDYIKEEKGVYILCLIVYEYKSGKNEYNRIVNKLNQKYGIEKRYIQEYLNILFKVLGKEKLIPKNNSSNSNEENINKQEKAKNNYFKQFILIFLVIFCFILFVYISISIENQLLYNILHLCIIIIPTSIIFVKFIWKLREKYFLIYFFIVWFILGTVYYYAVVFIPW